MISPYIMFHGTSSTNLKSILKKGLVANPTKKYWGDYSKSSLHMPSRKSLSGVYLSSDIDTARYGSINSVSLNGGTHLYVITEINPELCLPDEDSIWCHVEDAMNKVLKSASCSYEKASMFLAMIESNGRVATVVEKNFADHLHSLLREDVRHTVDYKMMRDVFYASLNRILAHLYKDDKKDYAVKYYSGHKLCKYPTTKPPKVNEAEEEYLNQIDLLTRVYKNSVYRIPNHRHSLRVLDGIGYQTENKIIGIVADDNREFNVYYGYMHEEFISKYEDFFNTEIEESQICMMG